MKLLSLFLTISLLTIISLQPLNYPVMLTLSIPTATPNTERVDNSVFRWLSAGGVDLITVHTWTTPSEIDTLLQNITAVVFMGQPTIPEQTSSYYKQAKYIYDSIKQLYSSTPSHNIPLLALGNDLAMIMSFEGGNITQIKQHSPNSIVFESLDDVNKYRILSELDSDDFVNLISSNICPNKLDYVITKDNFLQNEQIMNAFDLVATSRLSSDSDFVYVSIIEGKQYPIFGLSFHPEKVNYENAYQVPIPDSLEAVKAARLLGNSFVFYARIHNPNYMNYEMKILHNWIRPYGNLPEYWYGTYQYLFTNE